MKDVVLKTLTFVYRIFLMKLKIVNSVFVLNKCNISNDSNITLKKSYMSRMNITLAGSGNELINEGSTCIRGEIHIEGKDNVVKIEENCYLSKIRIVVRGNGCNVTIGKGVTCGSAFIACMGEDNHIEIGEDCMLAEDVDIWATDSHPIFDSENKLINHSKPIIIGKHVWIGKRSAVLKGVTIGDGAVIGMNTVVTKNIPTKSLSVGNPAKPIKMNVSWTRGFISE